MPFARALPRALSLGTTLAVAALLLAHQSAVGITAAADATPLAARHAIAMHGKPLLPQGFERFPYVNPAAPGGGAVTLGILGSYDSLNPFIIKGVPAAGLRDFLYESLLTRGLDEPFTLYGHIAESIEVPDDRSSITFNIDPKAKFSDGKAITADDILFSWKTLRDHGRPNHRAYYKKVTKAERVSDLSVRFDLEPGDRELPLILGLMPVLPAHLLNEESFQLTTLHPPIGSGPYTISQVDAGRAVVYKRNTDWWANDLATSRGRFNFDEIRYDYFRDDAAMFEAFKSGRIDMRIEEDPSRWAGGYGERERGGAKLVRREFDLGLPAGMNALAFNTRRAVFADPKVREGIIKLFDFSWINKNLYHGLYERTQSYFERSVLSSVGEPAGEKEQALLAAYQDAVSPEIMAGTYRMPDTDGTGRNRANWRAALKLFDEAGYQLKAGKLVNRKTGQQLAFELLAGTTTNERLFLAFCRDLEKLGIAARVRVVDSAQYQSRIKSYDYDMIQTRWPSSLSPGNEQIFRWSSTMAEREGTFNFAGVRNKAADAMIEAMLAARDEDDFVAAVRALDRVLLSGHYVLPLFHLPKQWVGYWTRLRQPDKTSLFGYQLDTWWAADAGDKAGKKTNP
ncbi:MAG: extracellular solute-binding protein [Alphaproteobacteria bacterium]|nr:extracellular solute-binding protein [Alphaproteobacteria bacterium]